jgi:insulysin
MLAFYDRFISPASSTRAKLSVYLRAKAGAVAEASSKKLSGEEQKTKFLGALEQYLGSQGMPVDTSALASRFKDVDIAQGASNQDAILAAFAAYLQHDAGMPEQVVAGAIEQGKPLLASVLASMGGASAEANADGKNAVAEGGDGGEKAEAVVIKDVRAFKASLPLTAGATPVCELSVFEELGSKL